MIMARLHFKNLRFLALLSIVALVVACGGGGGKGAGGATSGGSSAPAAQKTATVGLAFSLSGAAAQYGATQKNGASLAADEINSSNYIPGVKLNLLLEDDASDKAQGINVYQKFINQDKVAAIIGPTLSNTAVAADPVAQAAKVSVLAVSNTGTGITTIGDYIFRDSLAEADVVPQTVKAAINTLHFSKAAVLYANDDAFSKDGYEAFKKALDDNKIQIVDTETFATGDKDFSAQLTKARDAKPDVLVVEALLNPVVGLTVQARQLGITAPIVGGNGFNSPAFIQQAGRASEGVIVGAAWNSAQPNPKSQAFINAYKAKFNSDPDQFAAQAYAGVYIMAQAIKNGNSIERPAIRDNLAKIQNFDTVLGSFSFTAGRDANHKAVIQIVKDGKFQILP
jgi:branched-chain amino acid transport system substrate-binding protein